MTIDKGKLFGRNFEARIINLANGFTQDVTDLRIAFRIIKTNKAKGNKATIGIYNVAPKVRGAIISKSDKSGNPQVEVELKIGYGPDTKLFFRGTGFASTSWKPPNFLTMFELTDGSMQAKNVFNKTYDKGFPLDKVIKDMLDAVGFPLGTINPIGGLLSESRAFSGTAEGNLDSLSSKHGFIFDVQDGKSHILKKGDFVTRRVVVLEASSGLIGIPYWEGSIVRARSLLIPEIVPNALVRLVLPIIELQGTYEVAKVTAKGDNWGRAGDLELELIPRQLSSEFNDLASLEGIIA